MSAERKSHLVLVGCGEAAATHAGLLRSRNVPLSFASRDAAKAERYARRFGGVRSFGSYEEALAAPDITAVAVLTPPASHLELALAALTEGKHVVVEKPAFPVVSDFARARAAAKAAGRTVFVAENYFYKPIAELLRRVLAEDALGDPLVLQVNAVKRQRADGWRTDRGASGGGGLLEGGIHWINFMANVGLEVEDVSGYAAGREHGGAPPPDSVEESYVVVLRYRGGAVGTLTFSWEVPTRLYGLRMSCLYGRAGTLRFESNGLFALERGRRTRLRLPGFRDLAGYRAMWSDFLDAMRSGREPRMTLDMAERDVRWVHRAYASDERHA